MPTAILSSYTGDGFIVAADGMAQEKDGTVTTRFRRKLFQFGGNKSLAYAFAGNVAIGPDEGPEFSFDFRTRIEKAVEALSINRYATLKAYAERLARDTQRVLKDACKNPRITFDDRRRMDTTIAYVFISGYFKEVPASVRIRFYRYNRQLAKPEVLTQGLDTPMRSGSEKLSYLFTIKDPRFFNEKYFRPLQVPVPHLSGAMEKAIIASRAYIEACRSKKGRRLDPDFCPSIGGYIHMAVITVTKGFDWVPGFKPKDKTRPVPTAG
jgi:hypothetical protein